MAVIREEIENQKGKFVKNYSDKGMYIERDGVEYAEAIDPLEFADERIYNETDKPIEEEDVRED